MMREYISREAAINKLLQCADDYDPDCSDITVAHAISKIKEIPAADVAPIKRGNWRDDVASFYRKCSECGCCVEWNKKPFLFGDGEYNYCPNCGAKMEAQDG